MKGRAASNANPVGIVMGAGKKEEFPRHIGDVAWELLSPDLRCFYEQSCGKGLYPTRVLKGIAI
jgi:hypothetical protein